IVPTIHRSPCIKPKATDETTSATSDQRRKSTLSKSSAVRRRKRYPRKASSSAIGTVATAPKVLNVIQKTRIAADPPASAAGIASDASLPAIQSPAIQIANTRAPVAGAIQPKLQSIEYLRRKNRMAPPATTTRNGYIHSKEPA